MGSPSITKPLSPCKPNLRTKKILILSSKSEMGEVVLITGASRGIGLGLVKEFLSKGYHIAALQNYLRSNQIIVRHLVNNAGISTPGHPVEDPDAIKRKEMLAVFDTNVAGVARVTEACGV